MELSTKYNPAEIEQKWYQYWLENRFFHSEPNEKEPYTIVIPPPNVTGVLHMGHMLNNTIQDVLVRRARMQGKNACWVPGTDHASIATEAKVVQKLATEGIEKSDLTREEFLTHAWDWTHKHGGIILEQLKKLGCSCDWERTAFTMDEIRSKSVLKVFCDLYEKGKIYRGVRMVNWDPKALTALSDEEVNFKEQQGKLYYLRYKIVDSCHSDKSQNLHEIANIFELTDNGDFTIALYEILSNQCDYNPDKLSSVQRVLFLCMLLEDAGQADHILSFLQEEFPDYADEAVEALTEIGATKSAEIIKQAIELLPKDGTWFFDNVDENSENLMKKLDSEFSDYPDGLMRDLYRKYAEKHKDDLIIAPAEYAVIATTRPETILGDTAMCINPNDPKNAHLKGKKVLVPLINREIPVIEDEYVDVEFGTGCLKVTPAHDVNDYVLGEKYNLPSIDIFNDDGTLNENGAMYAGMDRFAVRKQIEKDLEAAGLLEKTEPYVNKVGFSERTDVPIEPKLSMQWFLKMEDLAKPALEAVEDDTIKFYPEKFKNTYRHWMTNIKDWCISRQLWWGHQIPAWYLPNGGFVVAETAEKALELANAQVRAKNLSPLQLSDLRQDDDCLDTWFSSWLWPLSVFDGINNPENEEIKYYYPTNDLVTAPEIIFFWVARMIMAGYEFNGKECFKNVYFTGIVRDKLGRKMSKSLGNSPEPLELIAKYGADGVRMGMLLTSPAGNDLPFDESLCEQGRNFNNKIWNSLRLVKGWETDEKVEIPHENKIAAEWFSAILEKTKIEVDDLFSKYRLSEALMLIYKLFWDEFSAWYLEIIKPEFGKPIDKLTYDRTIYFFEELLKLLHPFMPFITEELYHSLSEKSESIMFAQTAIDKNFNEKAINEFEKAKEIITGIRNIRQQKNISPKEMLTLYVKGEYNADYDEVIKKLGNVSEIKITDEKPSNAINYLVGTTEFSVPVEINADEEIEKMQTEISYLEGFLKSVSAKLSNEKFVANAKPEIVENERKKQADAESKIVSLRESINQLKNK